MKVGRDIVVIGGGMKEIEVEIKKKKIGEKKVKIVYRRGKERMNEREYEKEMEKINGVVIRKWLKKNEMERSEEGIVNEIKFEYKENRDGKIVGKGEYMKIEEEKVLKEIGKKLDKEKLRG